MEVKEIKDTKPGLYSDLSPLPFVSSHLKVRTKILNLNKFNYVIKFIRMSINYLSKEIKVIS